jgi:hypothetical protein
MPNADDSKTYNPYLELINWFAARTEQCRLKWDIEGDAITASASVPPLVSLRFAISDDRSGSERWSSFSVHTKSRELFRVDPNRSAKETSALVAAVNALFVSIMKSAEAKQL